MANQEQLERLLASAKQENNCKEWNAWRDTNPDEEIDLSGADFSNLNLKWVNLSSALLIGTNFTASDLWHSNFRESKISIAKFSDTKLYGAEFQGVAIFQSTFTKATLDFTDFSNASIIDADFSEADLYKAVFSEARIYNVNFKNSEFRSVKFNKADMGGVNFSGIELSNSDLCDLSLERTDFSGAIMTHSALRGAILRGSNFAKANLVWSNFSGAILESSNLSRADLRNCDLTRAELNEAVLDDADLRGSREYILNSNSIKGTKFSSKSKDPYGVMRRTYTGFNFTLVLIFTMMAIAPFAFKAIAYSFIGKFQSDYMSVDCNNPTQGDLTCERTLSIVMGFTEEPGTRWFTFGVALLVLLYSAVRYFVTLQISGMREAEERSQYAPAWNDYKMYYWVHHYFLRWVLYGVIALTLWRIGDMLWTPLVIPVH